MRLLSLSTVVLAVTFAPASRAETAVTVASLDGRVLSGVVDARTDGERLWLRRDEGPIALASSIPWDELAAAEIDGAALDTRDLRAKSREMATVGAPLSAQLPATATGPSAAPETLPVSDAGATRRARVRSLVIVNTCLGNFDHDVEPDGFTLSVAALDENNVATPVRGALTARLFGLRRSNRTSQLAFGNLDAWSMPVRPSDFVDGVATYELRFRRTAPEFQFALLPDAAIEVQLGAFGEGNFAASAPVVLRPYNPLRDNLQLYEQTRFMPREWHGRNPQSSPTVHEGLWPLWQY